MGGRMGRAGGRYRWASGWVGGRAGRGHMVCRTPGYGPSPTNARGCRRCIAARHWRAGQCHAACGPPHRLAVHACHACTCVYCLCYAVCPGAHDVSNLKPQLWRQGDQEKADRLPMSPLCDRDKAGVSKSQLGKAACTDQAVLAKAGQKNTCGPGHMLRTSALDREPVCFRAHEHQVPGIDAHMRMASRWLVCRRGGGG